MSMCLTGVCLCIGGQYAAESHSTGPTALLRKMGPQTPLEDRHDSPTIPVAFGNGRHTSEACTTKDPRSERGDLAMRRGEVGKALTKIRRRPKGLSP